MLTKAQKRNREAWRNLLYSGEFTQESNALHSLNGYCCLGVACEIPRAPQWGELEPGFGQWAQLGYRHHDDVFSHPWKSPDGEKLDHELAFEKFGLSARDQSVLMFVNDQRCLSFPEIADVLYLSEVSGETIEDIIKDSYTTDHHDP